MATALESKYEPVSDDLGKILNKDFVSRFRKGYLSLDGTIVPEYYQNFGSDIKDLKVHKDDVWICSFPKCGTTWSQEMVWLIANNLDYEGAKVFLAQRFPFLEHTPLFDYRELSKTIPGFQVPIFATDSVGYINNLKSPRFIKTHLPYNLLPEQIKNNSEHPKIIYVSRDAKDCLISYFHHCGLMEGYKGSFSDFYKLFMGDRLLYAPFWPHILSYWERRHQNNIIFLKFEDMKADLPSVIRKVAKFLGKEYSDEQIATLTKHLSFESMKNNPAVNYESVIETNKKYGLTDAKGNFMRSGKVGDSKTHLTAEQLEEINLWSKKSVEGTEFQI